MYLFHKRQILIKVPNHEIIHDVSSRWNPSQQMMERLVEQRRVLMDNTAWPSNYEKRHRDGGAVG